MSWNDRWTVGGLEESNGLQAYRTDGRTTDCSVADPHIYGEVDDLEVAMRCCRNGLGLDLQA